MPAFDCRLRNRAYDLNVWESPWHDYGVGVQNRDAMQHAQVLLHSIREVRWPILTMAYLARPARTLARSP